MDELVQCGGQDTTVIFMNLTILDVEPVCVFSAVADIVSQVDWVPGVKESMQMKAGDSGQEVSGIKMTYSLMPLPDRVCHEWAAFSHNGDGSWSTAKDLWFAATTQRNDELKAEDTEQEGGWFGLGRAVEVDSCLSSYHMKRLPDGRVYVECTNNVNGHPELALTPQMVAELSWSKMVEFANVLKARSREICRDRSKLWFPHDEYVEKAGQGGRAAQSCQSGSDTPAATLQISALYDARESSSERLQEEINETIIKMETPPDISQESTVMVDFPQVRAAAVSLVAVALLGMRAIWIMRRAEAQLLLSEEEAALAALVDSGPEEI
eukprot:TRINITY_DN31762_c0_g1_i4.p1 TRINITY_DN31762_c0_g1~~TRINITY_DN31762_c0_g1_i4.p1  ORF type:complete len:324 (+),score=58.66 TRINITY_DN31762_c0_g1_i4:287-1258(+)